MMYKGCMVDSMTKAAVQLALDPYSGAEKVSYQKHKHNNSTSYENNDKEKAQSGNMMSQEEKEKQAQFERMQKADGVRLPNPGTYTLTALSVGQLRAASAVTTRLFEVRDQRAVLVDMFENLGGKLWHW